MTAQGSRFASSSVAALVWGLATVLCLTLHLQLSADGLSAHRAELSVIYFAGGTLAFPLAERAVHLVRGGRWMTRFTAAFIALNIATLAATAILLGFAEWVFADPWEGTGWSLQGLRRAFFAMISALYRFAVIGARYYLPFGIVISLAASLWLARRAH